MYPSSFPVPREYSPEVETIIPVSTQIAGGATGVVARVPLLMDRVYFLEAVFFARDTTTKEVATYHSRASARRVTTLVAAATGTLTAAANASNNETVTIGGVVYTFKTSVAANGEVKVGADANASMLNLARAINNSGGTAGAGQDYMVAAAHTTVSAAASTNTVVVTARTTGTAGNAIATTDTGAQLSWGAATLASGSDGSALVGTADLLAAENDSGWTLVPTASGTDVIYTGTADGSNITRFAGYVKVSSVSLSDI